MSGGLIAEMLFRFVVGGAVVALFSLGGDVFKPHSFGGLFGAAPSVAIATMALTLHKEGAKFVATEALFMCGGALALGAYAVAVSWLLRHRRAAVPFTVAMAFPVWFVVALAFWLVARAT